MKKVLSAILGIYCLLDFVLCLESLITLGVVRNFAILWIAPAIVGVVLNGVMLFKKTISFPCMVSAAICDILFFVSPFLMFGVLLPVDIDLLLMWVVPSLCSVMLGAFVILEKKKTEKQ